MSIKLKAFTEAAPVEAKPIQLKLVDREDGEVSVVAVDEDGERVADGYLITFTSDGKIRLANGVNKTLGFSLDSMGRIEVVE